MNQKIIIISLLMTILAASGIAETAAQVTYKDYLRADAVMSYSDHVYSSAVSPHWLGDSHYFWYENHEKDGNFFYLVDAETSRNSRLLTGRNLQFIFRRSRNISSNCFWRKDRSRLRHGI